MMRLRTCVVAGVLALAGCIAVPTAGAATGSFANTSGISIPESGNATPYPSTITVGGATGTITDVNVSIDDFGHGYPSDVDMLLVGPSGKAVVLMSDAPSGVSCSTGVSGVDLTFDDAAAGTIPPDATLASGTYKPADDSVPFACGTDDDNWAVAPTGATLAQFNGDAPNGDWKLYVIDDTVTDGGSIVGWRLSIATAVVDQSQTTKNNFTTFCTNQWRGQTFTAGITGALEQVDLDIFNSGPQAGPLTVEIRDTTSNVPNTTVLATTTVAESAVVDNALNAVRFSPPAQVVTGHRYAIVAHADTCDSSSSGYGWNLSTAQPYPGGDAVSSITTGANWTIFTISDFAFRTYVIPTDNIVFGPLYDRPLTKGAFTVSATSSAGLTPVTFTSTTPSVCSATGTNGTTITPLTTGTCTIKADQAGDATYPAATKSRSFTVTKGTQAITFNALADRPVTKTPFTVAATSSSALPVSFTTSTPSVCTAGGTNGATISLLTTGTCTGLADQAGDANYAAAPQKSRSFTVTKVSQTITFGAIADRRLANSPFTAAATASSGLTPVTFTSTTPSVCTATGTNGATITLLTTGTCTIQADQAGNATYAAAPAKQRSFTVNP